MRWKRKIVWVPVLAGAGLLRVWMIFCGCASLPKDIQRPSSFAIDDGNETQLGRTFATDLANHPNQSGVLLLGNGLDAFVARVVLANLAERSIYKVAFRLVLDDGKAGAESIRGHIQTTNGEIVYDSEPYVGFWTKIGVGLIRLLLVESLL